MRPGAPPQSDGGGEGVLGYLNSVAVGVAGQGLPTPTLRQGPSTQSSLCPPSSSQSRALAPTRPHPPPAPLDPARSASTGGVAPAVAPE